MNDQTNIQKISFSLAKFKKWLAEKEACPAGRAQEAWDCPLANYLAATELPEGEGIRDTFLVAQTCVYRLSPTGAISTVFCSEIMERIIVIVDAYPEGTIWPGQTLLRTLVRAGL